MKTQDLVIGQTYYVSDTRTRFYGIFNGKAAEGRGFLSFTRLGPDNNPTGRRLARPVSVRCTADERKAELQASRERMAALQVRDDAADALLETKTNREIVERVTALLNDLLDPTALEGRRNWTRDVLIRIADDATRRTTKHSEFKDLLLEDAELTAQDQHERAEAQFGG